jgi:hypothetical protein
MNDNNYCNINTNNTDNIYNTDNNIDDTALNILESLMNAKTIQNKKIILDVIKIYIENNYKT